MDDSATTNDDALYDQRLRFVRTTLNQHFGRDPFDIDPIAYEPDCPFPYNNFIYRVRLAESPTKLTTPAQPATVLLPSTTTQVVMRLTNAAAGLNNANRVENEVAAMALARDALQPRVLVPAVYGWASAAHGQGWILEEFMPGFPLDQLLTAMSLPEQTQLLVQLADVVRALQRYRLPPSVTGYGGLTFGSQGDVVSAPMTLYSCGPFASPSAMHAAILRHQLRDADQHPLINGWRSPRLRPRLDAFVELGVDAAVRTIDMGKKTLVHGDLTASNLLFDVATARITAILDFDWAHVGSAADEFLRSFGDITAKVAAPYGQSAAQLVLRDAVLHGFPASPPPTHSAKWPVTRAWIEVLTDVGAQTPQTIKGIDTLAELHWLATSICPSMLCNPVIFKGRSPQQSERDLVAARDALDKYLAERGF